MPPEKAFERVSLGGGQSGALRALPRLEHAVEHQDLLDRCDLLGRAGPRLVPVRRTKREYGTRLDANAELQI